jgi:hypothetical protein
MVSKQLNKAHASLSGALGRVGVSLPLLKYPSFPIKLTFSTTI